MLADAGLEDPAWISWRESATILSAFPPSSPQARKKCAHGRSTGLHRPQAAGVIHTTSKKGFIKADIVSYDDFVAAEGSMVKIKEEGKLRQEGRDYVMQDGDIVEFKFNVSKHRFQRLETACFNGFRLLTVENRPFLNALGLTVSATFWAAVAIA